MPIGVEMLDGSSDVKMVADEGEMMYREWIDANRASLKPMRKISTNHIMQEVA